MYAISDKQQQYIDSIFSDGTSRSEDGCHLLINQARMLALALAASCPPGRELDLALEKLEECMLWTNAAIARDARNMLQS